MEAGGPASSMNGSRRPLLSLLDATLAFAASLLGVPTSFALWRIAGPETGMSIGGFAHVTAAEWAVFFGVFIGPAALLGTAAGYALRRAGRGKLAVAAATATAFAASLLGLGSFYALLSEVL